MDQQPFDFYANFTIVSPSAFGYSLVLVVQFDSVGFTLYLYGVKQQIFQLTEFKWALCDDVNSWLWMDDVEFANKQRNKQTDKPIDIRTKCNKHSNTHLSWQATIKFINSLLVERKKNEKRVPVRSEMQQLLLQPNSLSTEQTIWIQQQQMNTVPLLTFLERLLLFSVVFVRHRTSVCTQKACRRRLYILFSSIAIIVSARFVCMICYFDEYLFVVRKLLTKLWISVFIRRFSFHTKWFHIPGITEMLNVKCLMLRYNEWILVVKSYKI